MARRWMENRSGTNAGIPHSGHQTRHAFLWDLQQRTSMARTGTAMGSMEIALWHSTRQPASSSGISNSFI